MSDLIRWRPDRDFFNLRDDVNKLFGSFLSTRGLDDLEGVGWAPSVDIEETNNEFIIKADVPGVDKKDIKITLENNTLILSGERKSEKELKGKNYLRKEASYGSFMRSFNLPSLVDAKAIKASFKNGVLSITVPKSEEAKPKQIEIDIE